MNAKSFCIICVYKKWWKDRNHPVYNIYINENTKIKIKIKNPQQPVSPKMAHQVESYSNRMFYLNK